MISITGEDDEDDNDVGKKLGGEEKKSSIRENVTSLNA